MKIKALIGIDNYSLMVCHCWGNLYHLSIIERENIIHKFDGIYPNLGNAVDRGKFVIENLRKEKFIL